MIFSLKDHLYPLQTVRLVLVRAHLVVCGRDDDRARVVDKTPLVADLYGGKSLVEHADLRDRAGEEEGDASRLVDEEGL